MWALWWVSWGHVLGPRHPCPCGSSCGCVPFLADDNEGSSSDTAPLFQMAGDGKDTDAIRIPMLFLFSKEGSIILDALRNYEVVEVLLSDKARDRGMGASQHMRSEMDVHAGTDMGTQGFTHTGTHSGDTRGCMHAGMAIHRHVGILAHRHVGTQTRNAHTWTHRHLGTPVH